MAPPNKKVKKEVGHEEKAGSLRIAAENKLTRTPETSTELKGQNPEQLIHELQVHQIELEMKEEELRRIQHELEKSRYQYINLYELAPVGYLSLNDKRLVTKANLTAATLLGIERNKIINRGFSVFIAPEHQTTWLRYFQALSRQGEKSVINLTIRREDSTTFPGRLEGTCIGFDDSSFVIHMTISDISDIVAVQEDLRTSHSRLESAMETGNLAWWEMDCATGNVSFNERKARMLGYPAEQFSHYSDFTTLVYPDDYEPTMQAMRDHLSGVKKNYETDYRIRTIDGDYRWFHDTGGISAYDQDGVPLRVTGLVMDITERKTVEIALAESEQRYRLLIDGVPDYILVHRNGRILFVNPAAIEVIGRQARDLVGSDILDYIAPESRALVVAMVTKRAIGEVIHPYEITIITKMGERRVAEVHGSPIMYEGLPASLNVLSDITERKQAEEALLVRERAYRTLAENLPGIQP
ncbi:MAG: PAS domain S-box protein [Methanoregula sp.]|nr:PAS domain S-box protein [Methanoregula sp.]